MTFGLCGIRIEVHLYSHRFLVPKSRDLLSPPRTSEVTLRHSHIAFGHIHKTLEARLVLRILKMLIRSIRAEPRAAEIAKVRLALEAGHMVTAIRFLAWNCTRRTGRRVAHDKVEGRLVLLC